MNTNQYEKASNAIVGAVLEALQSYNLSNPAISVIKRLLWSELDKQFGGLVDEKEE